MAVVGQRVGHYEVREEIGRGGMAVVYVARQTDLDRLVALKELPAFHAADAAFAERFSRESRIAGSLSHPNVVVVFEYFEADGTPFIAMEYVGRGSLRPHVGRMSLAQVGGVMEATLSALSHAESRGIVHRDLKPENLMVTAEGTVKVADFGIAKALGDLASRGFRTATGTTIGTPAYMAPEQALGAEVTGATDLYAVGVVAFELLTGRVPFTAESPMAVLFSHVNEPPPALRELRPELDEGVDRWVARMLAKAPADRPPTALAAWEELEETLTGSLGPLWRRSARLLDDVGGERGATPLTPAPFDDEADGYVTFGARAAPPPVAPAPAPASPAPPVEPPEPVAPVEPVAPTPPVAPVAPVPPVEPVAADVPAFSVSPSLLDFGSVVAGEPVEPRTLAVVPLGDRTMAVEVEADDPRIHVVRDGLAVRVSIVAAAAGTLDGAVLLHAAGTRVAVPVRAEIAAAAPAPPEPAPSPAAASVDERRPSRRRNVAIGLAAAAVAVVAGIFGLTRGGSGGAPSAATTSTPPVSSATTHTATAPAATASLPPLDDDAFGIEWSTDVYSADPRGPVVRIGPTGPSGSVDAPAPPRSIAAANYGVLVGTDRGAFWRSFDLQGTWHRLVADPAPFIYSDGGLPTGIIVLRAGAYRVCGVPPPGSEPPTTPPVCGAPLADVPHGLGTASENGGTGVYEVPEGFGAILVVDDAALRTYEVGAGAISPVRTIPLSPDRGGHGTPIPYGGQVYVPVDGGVAIIDPASGRRVRRIALEATPAAIWIVPGRGLLYAALPTVNAVVRVPLGAGGGQPSTYRHGDRPVAVAGSLQPDKASRAIFVAYAGDRSVWRLDPSRVERPTCVARAGRHC